MIALSSLPIGKEALILKIDDSGNFKRRMYDLGLIPNARISAAFKSPFGDPVAYEVGETLISLRIEESSRIWVEVSCHE